MKRKLGILTILLFLLIFGVLAYIWIKERRDYAITNAVFVKAEELTNLGFQVTGRVVELKKDVGDEVRKGEIIALLDPTDYELNLESLSSKIENLKAQRQAIQTQLKRLSKETQLNLESAKIVSEEVSKEIATLQAQLKEILISKEKAYKDLERFKGLHEKGLIPTSKLEEAKVQYETLQEKEKAMMESIERLRLSSLRSLKDVERAGVSKLVTQELEDQILAISKEIESLEAQREIAENQLSYTQLTVPFDGVVAKRFVSSGDMVRTGQPVFAILKKNSIYVEALLEENKLWGVEVGSLVYFIPDAFKDRVFIGRVVEISPVSAATFALVPRDVSAGEFTKVVQRIPVKVEIQEGPVDILRVGMGGSVKIKRIKDGPR